MKDKKGAALFCAALGNIIFGFSFMFSRIALNVTTPLVMLAWRFTLTFLLMCLLGCIFAKLDVSRSDGIDWRRFDLRGKNILPLIALGLIQPVGYFFCESYGISLTNATFSGVIIALIPIAGIAGGALLLGEKPRRMQLCFALLSVAGVVVMTLQQNSAGQIRPAGVLLLIGAVLTGAYYSILSRKLSARFSAFERTFVMMACAAVVFDAAALIEQRGSMAALIAPLASPGFVASVLYLSVLSSIVAFMALNFATGRLTLARSTAFSNLTTVVSLLAGAVFLKEPFTFVSLIAAAMIVAGVYGTQKY